VKPLENEIIKLKETIESVVAALKNKEMEMKVLEQRISCIESKAVCSDNFECTQCEYKASSSTALKTHVTKKHKSETLRDSSSDKDINVSLPSEDRDESMPFSADTSFKECDPTPFKCDHCEFETTLNIKLLRHKAVTHESGVPHTSFWGPNKCYMCMLAFDETEEFKDHMIDKHRYTFNCGECECGETSPIGQFWAAQENKTIGMLCLPCVSNDPGW
jgi:hypothetical protein